MKLKTIALAMLLSAGGGAYAAPALQTCAPMEVTHNGGAGLSYLLSCNAGGWALTYSGSVPAGTDSVLARYRVQVSNPDGSNFTQTRSVRLPSPAMLGQALLREAVVLDNGDLALRDCPEFSCTLYRPLGSAEKMAKATITVTPEVKRLTDEAARLSAELTQRQTELVAQNGKVSSLELDVRALKAKLDGTEKSLAEAKAALEAAKEQYNADIAGLLDSGKADLAKATASAGAQSSARVAELTSQLAAATAALDAARKELAECKNAHNAAEAAKAKADAEVESRGKQVQANASQSADVATVRLKLEAANSKVDELTGKVSGLERALADANTQLQAAKQTQTERDAALGAAADNLAAAQAKTQPADLSGQLAKALSERAAAADEVARLTKELAGINPAVEKLKLERDDALKGAQQVARDMLEALDQYQLLQTAKDDAEKALESTTNKVMDLSAKLEAANLARELAMQAATTAHADADAQNLKNQELAQQVARAKEQIKALVSERYDLYAKLQATKVELEAATGAKASGSDTVTALRSALYTVKVQQNYLQNVVDGQKQHIGQLETVNAAQAKEIAALRQQLAEMKGRVPQNEQSQASRPPKPDN
ncbi:hypothetical protein WL29_20910 [Burkholderia ubonensis]|uniref:Uncharacterized protein n=1 Tax=Burkholderia ubonensis TaxID=101571 RepID=A0A106QCM3_9BURK|nr:hypothetical protein [Burkholderia ubonensis]KWA83828.1 hypothetical protein WL29_20910 [Burkholderia ubonensis]